jgi:hypothetical protein
MAMDADNKQFNLFVRRWQVRLFILGMTLPALIFVTFGFVFRREEDGSAFAGIIVGAAFLLVALLLQGWRYRR